MKAEISMTAHEYAVMHLALALLPAEEWRAIHPGVPGWLADRIVSTMRRAAIRRAARYGLKMYRQQESCRLDFRPGIGSGRSAHWHAPTYRRYALCAQRAHETLGCTGEAARAVARGSLSVDYPSSQTWPVAGAVGPRDWPTWYQREVVPAIAEDEAQRTLAEVRGGGRISGYLVDSVLSWQGRGGYDYSHCSGCEQYTWFAAHPETWAELLAAAPIGASGEGWEQTYPHEHERAARLAAAGWTQIFRNPCVDLRDQASTHLFGTPLLISRVTSQSGQG